MHKYSFPITINGEHCADATVEIRNNRITACEVTTAQDSSLPVSDAEALRIAEQVASLSATFDDYEEEAADSSRY